MRRLWIFGLLLALEVVSGHAQETATLIDAPLTAKELIDQGGTPPKPIKSGEPQFTDEARSRRINGRCLVSLIVDANGMPQNVQVVRCTDASFVEESFKAGAQYRFKPASTHDGTPVPAKIKIEINFRMVGGINPVIPVRYGFMPPPGVDSPDPDVNGVYSLNKTATPPSITRFSDEGYGDLAFATDGDDACFVLLTISADGVATEAHVIHCDSPSLEKPVVQSLFKSQYKPGRVNGKAVPMRASVHLEIGGSPSK